MGTKTGKRSIKIFQVSSISQGGKIAYDSIGQQIRISALARWRKVREFTK